MENPENIHIHPVFPWHDKLNGVGNWADKCCGKACCVLTDLYTCGQHINGVPERWVKDSNVALGAQLTAGIPGGRVGVPRP